ncbi:hypothetical protein [Staphylococcus lutrae]|uniref:Uncharacterized protein n=1 Tax=Staphylococcus lutrae TaxID=155085 RepID=A0AAC9WM86_9STAP|nr:hypothetical protein [Staphylococcus lutrae]ARJ50507.1 hypothetical protein B5P37_03865 [Staphylococcus lutrae]PNZ37408.1 hypothetical protein CD134_06420 [Staphylococcus lutrae]
MNEISQQPPQFQQQFEHQPIQRNPYHGKKKRSWISFILTLIAMVLVAIAAYSMYTESLIKMGFIDENVTFNQLQVIADQLTAQSTIDTSNVEQTLHYLIIALNAFFVFALINILFAILTLLFNRTVLKCINWFISLFIVLVPTAFLFYIHTAAGEIAHNLEPYLGHVDAATILAPSSALYNTIIYTSIAAVLYFVSLFFRNRYPKMRKPL